MSSVLRAKELRESGETWFVAGIFDGDGKGFGLADDDDEFAPAGDASV